MIQQQIKNMFDNQHSFICGQTQSGKTYFALKALEASTLPVFFFNPQYEDSKFIKADGSYPVNDLIAYMRTGGKIDFQPSTNLDFAQKQLDFIINELFVQNAFTKENPFIFAIDECHLYARQGNKSKHVLRIATGGFKFGFRGVFISQDPASVEKVILRQASRHIFFKLDQYNAEYIENKGFDFKRIDSMCGPKENHQGVLCDFGEIISTLKV